MLETVTIKNFRSLRDVTLNLQKVNLLIGPNNSGKTNFLKSLAFLKEHYNQRIQPSIVDFRRVYFKNNYNSSYLGVVKNNNPISFGFRWQNQIGEPSHAFYQLDLMGFDSENHLVYIEGIGNSSVPINIKYTFDDIESLENVLDEGVVIYAYNSKCISKKYNRDLISKSIGKKFFDDSVIVEIGISENTRVNFFPADEDYAGEFLKYSLQDVGFKSDLSNDLNSIKIYRPDPAKITKENDLFTGNHVNEDCSNLVSFLDNMRDGHDDVWQAIQKDLKKCIPDFEGISFEKVQINGKESLGKRFGLRDKEGKVYWADELSEGTIYFLALLAIVHQPDPPKVLLLEEPEKGIHPRRIAEVMDLIFRLAEDKDIQIIMTSHSTQVVDAFQDIPESVFVFDMIDGETKVKNLLTDILEPDAKDAEAKNFPPIDYSKRSLSEHWATGLLGGVPH